MPNIQQPPKCPHCGFTIFSTKYVRCERCGQPLSGDKPTAANKADEDEVDPATRERVRIAALNAEEQFGDKRTKEQLDWARSSQPRQSADQEEDVGGMSVLVGFFVFVGFLMVLRMLSQIHCVGLEWR